MNTQEGKKEIHKLWRLGALVLAAVLVLHLVSPAAGALSTDREEIPVQETVAVISAEQYLEMAETAIASEDYAQAQLHLTAAREKADPETEGSLIAQALIKTVSIQILQKEYSQAIANIEGYLAGDAQLEDDSLKGILQFLLGGCRMEVQDYQKAVEAFKAAAELGYEQASCLEQILIASFELGDYPTVTAAGETLLAAEEIQFSDPGAVCGRLGISYVYLGQFERALELLEQANGYAGDPNGNGYYRGICLISLERPEEAVEAFTQGIEAGDLVAYSYYNRGVCYLDLLDYEQAKLDMEQAIALDEDAQITASAQEVLQQLNEYLQ